MAELDLSVWVGKPPSGFGVVVRRDGKDAHQESDLSSTSSEPEDVFRAKTRASPRGGSSEFSQPSTRSSSSDPSIDRGFYIDVPRLHDLKHYEHLPGYFTLIRVIREVNPGHYLVKLKSGELEQVSKTFR